MGQDAGFKWATIATLAGATAIGAVALGARVATGEIATLGVGSGILSLVALRLRSSHPRAVACVIAWLQFLLFSAFYTAVTCLLAHSSVPLVDSWLKRVDVAMGIQRSVVAAWAERHWLLQESLAFCYHTIVLQTLLVIPVLCWLGGEDGPWSV